MAYNNSIDLAEVFLPVMDEVYKAESKTSVLDLASDRIRFAEGNTVNIYDATVDGLGDYDRNAGYPTGSIVGKWTPYELKQDRGRSLITDAMDNEETLGMAFGTLGGQFLRESVVPEIDAYTFAKIAGTSGIGGTNGDITVGTTDVAALIDAADEEMGDAEVPDVGSILFISYKAYAGLQEKITRLTVNGDKGIDYNIEMYNGKRVIRVPKGRFNTKISLLDGVSSGETAGGFAVPTDGTSYPINFMIVHPSAVIKTIKHADMRVFNPDQVQTHNGWRMNYRIYHDVFVKANKLSGIYMHRASTANS